MARNKGSVIGSVAFLVGLLLAAVIAIFNTGDIPQWIFWIMAMAGILVGLFNVTTGETNTFLLASLAFLLSFEALSRIIESLAFGWNAVTSFFNMMTVFVAPAAAVVAVIALFQIARDE